VKKHPPARVWKTFLLALLLLLSGAWGAARAGDDAARAALDKPVPEGLDDLRAVQKQVKVVLEKVIPCTVGLELNGISGSGVIVSEDGYVLTAAHVAGKPGLAVTVILSDGRRVKGKTLGMNKGIDSGLLKISDEGKWPFADMGSSADLKKGQWCITTGHPGGYKKGRPPVVRLGRVLEHDDKVVRTDCTLVGGDSGGPLFDLDGKVIGIHSRIGGPITLNMHVPVDTYRDTWDRLVKGDSWGELRVPALGAGGPYLGLTLDLEAKECVVTEVTDDSPAARAGLKPGDVLTKFDDRKLGPPDDLGDVMRKKKRGDEVTLEVLRDKEILTVKVKIGKRPG
jgi:serine protease Do